MKLKKCRICSKEFKPFSVNQRVCGWPCAIRYGRQQDKKKEKAIARKQKKEFYDDDVKHQHKLTKTVFNRLRVLQEKEWFASRGLEPECISCGKTNMDWCCGHLKTVGSHGNLRYDEKNTFLQCNYRCNMNLSGNLQGNKTTRGYIQGLHDRFGSEKAQEILDYCNSHDETKKWTATELIEMRKEFKKQIREFESGFDKWAEGL